MKANKAAHPELVGIRNAKPKRVPVDLYKSGTHKGRVIVFTDGTRYVVRENGQLERIRA